MFKPHQRQTLFSIALSLAIAAAAPVFCWAQEENRELVSPPQFTVPTPSGFKVLFMFSGARDTTTAVTNSAATSVHCTNFDTNKDADIVVEFADFDNNPVVQLNLIITPQRTRTFSTQNTAFYIEDATAAIADDIDQGSVAVLGDRNSRKVICTAVVLDPVNNPPAYVHTLSPYDGRGKF